jgi:hypothetical protein
VRSIFLVLSFLFLFAFAALAQNPGFPPLQQTLPQPSVGMGTPTVESDPMPDPHMTREMEKRAAEERQASLKNDTDKLLKLSQELKTYVDKTNQNVLSLDVIRKAEEIEKLAKSVKDKMKGPN